MSLDRDPRDIQPSRRQARRSLREMRDELGLDLTDEEIESQLDDADEQAAVRERLAGFELRLMDFSVVAPLSGEGGLVVTLTCELPAASLALSRLRQAYSDGSKRLWVRVIPRDRPRRR
jgi:hypothetical protein